MGTRIGDRDKERIATLRHEGHSWESIALAVGMHSKTAKRAYTEWRQRSDELEMERARLPLRQKALRQHIGDLTHFAQVLAGSLDLVDVTDERTGDRFLSDTLRNPALLLRPGHEMASDRERQAEVQRKITIVHDALLQHLSSTSFDRHLREYARARTRKINALSSLQEEVRAAMALHLETSDAGGSIAADPTIMRSLGKGLAAQLHGVLLETTLADPTAESFMPFGRLETDVLSGGIRLTDSGEHVSVGFGPCAVAITVGRVGSDTQGVLRDAFRATLDDIRERGVLAAIAGHVRDAHRVMQRSRESLVHEADGLILEPLLLRTRCSMCPL